MIIIKILCHIVMISDSPSNYEGLAMPLIGCESHIDESFATSEVFPSNFTAFRRDQSLGGGGVFLCFKNTLDVSEESTLQVDAELIWARLKIHKRQPIYIC